MLLVLYVIGIFQESVNPHPKAGCSGRRNLVLLSDFSGKSLLNEGRLLTDSECWSGTPPVAFLCPFQHPSLQVPCLGAGQVFVPSSFLQLCAGVTARWVLLRELHLAPYSPPAAHRPYQLCSGNWWHVEITVGIFLCFILYKGRYFLKKYTATTWWEQTSALSCFEPLNIRHFAEAAVRVLSSDLVIFYSFIL